MYDTRAGKRPTKVVSYCNSKITALCQQAREPYLWVGDARGNLTCLDLRVLNFDGKLRAFGGAITRAVYYEEDGVMMTSCMDGFVRLHDVVSRQQKWRVYCKAPVASCCIVRG